MIQSLLNELNERLLLVHTTYENLFWTSYMGDHSVDEDFVKAETAVTEFRVDSSLSERVNEALITATGELREKLLQWQRYFSCYQVPREFLPLRTKIAEIETAVAKVRAEREEGYIDPTTRDFVKASCGKMSMMLSTHDDEATRKACWEAREKLAIQDIEALVELVGLRNEYARALGYEDFYAYKLHVCEGMTKDELFGLCDDIYSCTKYGFANVREMEKTRPGLRLPWNYSYMLAGDLIKKKDPYLQFSDALLRWGRSFAALGINYHGATLQLDLLDREGKYNNGFCHWPELVHWKDGERIPGKCNFTCNAVPDQIGSGARAIETLFHEGGHAAHLTNVEMSETCMNHEYAPQSVAWAETHSQFLDTMQSSIEWLTRYAKNGEGAAYPFANYEEAVRRLNPIEPLDFMHILRIVNLERELYTTLELTKEKALEIARRMYRMHFDMEVDSYSLLLVPHIYAWESSCYYHGYGLATLTLMQWREYFYTKYGYIVDNPEVGREMREVWKLGASKTFAEFVLLATGKKLSADAYLTEITSTVDETLACALNRIERLKDVPEYQGSVNLNATIRMVSGEDIVADNTNGFEEMAETYRKWVLSRTSGTGAV
jgi:hypothetical protein